MFRVVCNNKYGASKPSYTCYGQTLGAPREVDAPTYTNLTPTTVTLQWKESSVVDPDDPIQYGIEMSQGKVANFKAINPKITKTPKGYNYPLNDKLLS